MSALLEVTDLTIEFPTRDGPLRAVDGLSYSVSAGEILGIVGESGSGKSVSAMAVLGLVRRPGRVTGGSIRFDGRPVTGMSARELRALRGGTVSMVFQDAMAALNPVMAVGRQIAECLRLHQPAMSRAARRARAIELLARVGIPEPESRFSQFPHELSGGMRQRVMIAMAIANSPRLIIADEPTTALDVTIQAQILELLRGAQRSTGAATILITHDLRLVAEFADRVCVMYAGRVAEEGPVAEVFRAPRHPYTAGLLASVPRTTGPVGTLPAIPGAPPNPLHRPAGCAFRPRCGLSRGRADCADSVPLPHPVGPVRVSACHFAGELAISGDAGLLAEREPT